MTHRRITILIVDDHEVVRQGLRALLSLESDLRIVGDAAGVHEAIAAAARLQPDVALIDVKLPDGSGVEACRHILSASPKTRLLMLSSYADDATVVDALQRGAHGYVLKDVRSHDLIDALRTVAGGRGYLDPRVAQQTLLWIKHRTTAVPGELPLHPDRLSPQERAILPLLAEGKTNKEIAAHMQLSEKTVKNYLAHIFDKLQVRRRTEAVSWYIRTTQPSSKTPASRS